MGMRFRLKGRLRHQRLLAANQIILRRAKKYGMILADNGSAWYMSGSPDSRWNNSDLNSLHERARLQPRGGRCVIADDRRGLRASTTARAGRLRR